MSWNRGHNVQVGMSSNKKIAALMTESLSKTTMQCWLSLWKLNSVEDSDRQFLWCLQILNRFMNRKHKFLGVYNQLWVILLWFTRSILGLWQRLLWFPDCGVWAGSPNVTRVDIVYYFTNWSAQTERKGVFWCSAPSPGWNNTNLTNLRATRIFGLLSISRGNVIIVQCADIF